MSRILIAFSVAIAALPALAQTQQQNDWCVSPSDNDKTIYGCSSLIGSGRLSRNGLMGAYNNRGRAYKAKGLYDLAIADETKAIELMPDTPFPYINRANAYAAKGLYDQAIADETKAIELKPDFAQAYGLRAWTYHLKNADADGLPDAEKAVALAPNSSNSIETRAEIYERLGRRDNAIADYRAALKIEPGHQAAKDGLARLGVGP